MWRLPACLQILREFEGHLRTVAAERDAALEQLECAEGRHEEAERRLREAERLEVRGAVSAGAAEPAAMSLGVNWCPCASMVCQPQWLCHVGNNVLLDLASITRPCFLYTWRMCRPATLGGRQTWMRCRRRRTAWCRTCGGSIARWRPGSARQQGGRSSWRSSEGGQGLADLACGLLDMPSS